MSKVLYHHGIDGQKWGVRNGPPYPLGYDDHSSSEKKKNSKSELSVYDQKKKKKSNYISNSSLKFIRKNVRKGLTEEEAAKKLEQRGKALMKAGAAVLGVGAAYCLVRYGLANSDFTIKAGDTMYRIASSGGTENHDLFYASTNQYDRMKYKGMYTKQKKMQGVSDVYEKTLSANKDIKIAGIKSAEKIYNELRETDEYFRKNTLIFGDYERYNQRGMMEANLFTDEKANKMFFDKLRENGYGGLVDVNDSLKSGYDSVRPVIFFGQNTDKSVNVESVHKVTNGEFAANLAGAYPAMLGQAFINQNYGPIAVPVLLGTGYAKSKNGRRYLNSLGVNTSTKKDDEKHDK